MPFTKSECAAVMQKLLHTRIEARFTVTGTMRATKCCVIHLRYQVQSAVIEFLMIGDHHIFSLWVIISTIPP